MPTGDLIAYDLYLRAFSHLGAWQKGRITLALDLLGEALKRDPHYGPALVLAARCHHNLHLNGWTNDPESNRCQAVDLARRALGVAADDPAVLVTAAYVLAYFGEDIDAVIGLNDRALALNPSFARGWMLGGYLRLWAGQPEAAIIHFETTLRLNPRADRASSFLGIGMAHFMARRFEDAQAMFLRALQEHPSWVPTHRFLASCYAHMGRLDEAREAVRQLRTGSDALAQPRAPRAVSFRSALGSRRGTLIGRSERIVAAAALATFARYRDRFE
jgi:tetratricopeptide (TPR) repeat protein